MGRIATVVKLAALAAATAGAIAFGATAAHAGDEPGASTGPVVVTPASAPVPTPTASQDGNNPWD